MPDTSPPGVVFHAKGWLAGALRYLKSRLALAGIEAKEAAGKYGMAAALAIGALALALLGYIFLVITAVFGIATTFDNERAWIVILGIAALLHVAAAAALAFFAWKGVKGGVFEMTIEELKNDRTWLEHTEK